MAATKGELPVSPSTKVRKPAKLRQSVQRELTSYALAAGAAGASVMALAQPSQAKIVYTPIDETLEANQTLAIDINHDGIVDVTLTNILGSEGGYLSATAPSLNHIAMTRSFYASALQPGQKVGTEERWRAFSAFMDFCSSHNGATTNRGPWSDVNDRYLGLEFTIQGQIHFGWARLNVRHKGCKIIAVLTGYAYETIPRRAITTGKISGPDTVGSEKEPNAMLGALALGSAGLVAWRRSAESNWTP
jgi:hypothetical protein